MTMNINPQVWGENANEFVPERWIVPGGVPPPSELPHGWSGLVTFCDGPRNCIGYKLGMSIMSHAPLVCPTNVHVAIREHAEHVSSGVLFGSRLAGLGSLTAPHVNSDLRVQGYFGDPHALSRVPRNDSGGAQSYFAHSTTSDGWTGCPAAPLCLLGCVSGALAPLTWYQTCRTRVDLVAHPSHRHYFTLVAHCLQSAGNVLHLHCSYPLYLLILLPITPYMLVYVPK